MTTASCTCGSAIVRSCSAPGEPYVVPRGVEHQTYAEREASLLLIEPTGTPNTGDPTTAAP